MKKHHIYWICQITGWAIYCIAVLLKYIFNEVAFNEDLITKEFLLQQLIILGILVSVSHLYHYLIKYQEWLNLPIESLLTKVSTAILFFALFSTLLIFSIRISFANLILSEIEFNEAAIMILKNFVFLVFLFLLWNLFYFSYQYFEKYRLSLRMDNLNKDIQLNQLKSQMNPHFIFNALNSIRALVDENPKVAKKSINQLSNILRKSLLINSENLIPLTDEFKIVEDYLKLEKIRFEERLEYSIDLVPEIEQFNIPPLLIQTLIENCIKHGISQLMAGGKLHVKTRILKKHLCLEIENSGQYINSLKNRRGVGILNTQKRLKLTFGNQYSFKIYNKDTNLVATEIKIPKVSIL